MAKVVIKNLVKHWKNFTAVDNISLEIQEGEFFVFLGPSGCGKTTTLRMIAGLEEVTSGEIYIGDRLVNDLLPKDRDIAMVFQNYGLYPHMNIRNNIAYPLKIRKIPKEQHDELILKAAKKVEMEHLLDKKPQQLSGGQRQRVALARAIVREPNCFLMDEPLSNLDAKLRVSTRGEIKRLQNELKVTTIYVTHDQVEAMTMADRVAVMKDGKIAQLGTPQEIYNTPDNIFVAGFIGAPPMNIIKGKVNADGVFEAEGVRVAGAEQYRNQELYIGFRAEDVEANHDVIQPQIDASIYNIELLGDCKMIEIKLHESIVYIKTHKNFQASIGDIVKASLQIERCHFFDVSTGNRLIPN